MNGGPYQWITQATVASYCDAAGDVCVNRTNCGGEPTYNCVAVNTWSNTCKLLGATGCTSNCDCCSSNCAFEAVFGNWMCITAGCNNNGVCEAGENSTNCSGDCCDASTPCGTTHTGASPTEWCRSMNGGPYAWITLAAGSTYCDSSSEICSSTSTCQGTTYYCKGLAGPNWVV
ncbi:MAG: hypothetical protein HY599_02905, partial [Candidatus Omnitrophica bacterium]|nr:hypothetical protein [Candidatus Omnitrophota bacterium]